MILIIGGGLSGLVTACRLKSHGIAFKILESRNRLGGRIHTIYEDDQAPMEMGAAWFTEEHTYLIDLLNDLGLSYYNQRMGNTAYYQPNSSAPAQLVNIPDQPPSYRITGGSSQLIHKLVDQLDPGDYVVDQSVSKISFRERDVEVVARDTFYASKIVLALPPKLWASNIEFKPAVPDTKLNIAMHTHTWMERSIKVAVSYKKPLWESHNNSGTLFSNAGPITEFYDHSNRERTAYALCGFVNSDRAHENPVARKSSILHQLHQIYGADALDYLGYEEKVWSDDSNTFTKSVSHLAPHQNNGHPAFAKALYQGKILLSSSETAPQFPGYMDGAINAGQRVAQIIIDQWTD